MQGLLDRLLPYMVNIVAITIYNSSSFYIIFLYSVIAEGTYIYYFSDGSPIDICQRIHTKHFNWNLQSNKHLMNRKTLIHKIMKLYHVTL